MLAFESSDRRSVHYVHEAGSFVPLAQATRQGPIALTASLASKDLMGPNGRYDIDRDPLWNGEAEKAAGPGFRKEEIAYYQVDHLGTPQELTDHEGTIAWSAQYKAWGQAREVISDAARKAGISNPIRFQGQYLDEETGLHYNRYRYYDPHSGRFASKDPIRLGGGLNLYHYGPNSTDVVDPYGLCSTKLNNSLGGKPYDQKQAHHLIPEEIWNENMSFFNKIGMENMRDHRSNGLLMPSNERKARQMGRRYYHCSNHNNYSHLVRLQVEDIRATLNKVSKTGRTSDFDLLIAQCEISASRLA